MIRIPRAFALSPLVTISFCHLPVIEVDLRELSKDLAKTELVYWRDSYLKILDAELLRVEPDGGKKAYLILRSTIFHPKSILYGLFLDLGGFVAWILFFSFRGVCLSA